MNIQNKEVYIVGDININSLKKDRKTSIRNYYNEIYIFGLTNLINVPTRVTNPGGTLIDHLYKSSESQK